MAPEHRVVGSGIPIPGRLRPRRVPGPAPVGSRPFLLYAGRREGGKGWDDLLRGYTLAVTGQGLDIDLVSVGVGDVDRRPRWPAG